MSNNSSKGFVFKVSKRREKYKANAYQFKSNQRTHGDYLYCRLTQPQCGLKKRLAHNRWNNVVTKEIKKRMLHEMHQRCSKDNQSNKLVKKHLSTVEQKLFCRQLVVIKHFDITGSQEAIKKCLHVQSPRQGLKFIRLDT